MRGTVLLSDILILFPALVLVSRMVMRSNVQHKSIELLVLVLTPPMILIDHGHFQYNGIRYIALTNIVELDKNALQPDTFTLLMQYWSHTICSACNCSRLRLLWIIFVFIVIELQANVALSCASVFYCSPEEMFVDGL